MNIQEKLQLTDDEYRVFIHLKDGKSRSIYELVIFPLIIYLVLLVAIQFGVASQSYGLVFTCSVGLLAIGIRYTYYQFKYSKVYVGLTEKIEKKVLEG